MHKKNIIIAFGGASPEHEVSVLTALQAVAAIEDPSVNPVPLYITKSGQWLTGAPLLELEEYEKLDQLEKKGTPCYFTKNSLGQTVLREEKTGLFSKPAEYPVYAVLAAFHGADGENGAFQGVCELYNVPYTGSGVIGSSAGMDKVTAKRLCRAESIPVTDGIDFLEQNWIENEKELIEQAEEIDYPLVVKPVHLGSSIGVKVVKERKSLIKAVETAFRYDAHVLIEKAITPLMEINCSVLGTPQKCMASVCERPLGSEELLSFRDKYLSEEGSSKGMASASRKIPADIPDKMTREIQDLSVRIFQLFDCSGVARLDFLVNSDSGEVYFNEINTIPGSFSFYLWKESGIPFSELIHELLEIALERHREKNGRILSYETNLLSQKAVKGIKGLKGTK
ncbi:MAG: D-alanine--D-alanine ligase [Balneolaceae bacterium]|nr:D-alanine--D-alanine ligase [Balneolaceae bacterium]MCH8548125.1 D-alanine--D-alanine ligase [Balneolaceae bacterium]